MLEKNKLTLTAWHVKYRMGKQLLHAVAQSLFLLLIIMLLLLLLPFSLMHVWCWAAPVSLAAAIIYHVSYSLCDLI